MTTDRKQAMILMYDGSRAFELARHLVSGIRLQCHLACVFENHHVIFMEGRGVLGDRFDLYPQCGKGRTEECVGMAYRNYVRMLFM